MNLKLILMTKDEKELIKPWLTYHGERLGYENLHIVDDSEDQKVLDFYKNHKHLNFHLHRDETGTRNLNNMTDTFTKIQNSIKEDEVFFIKMDADEFLVHLSPNKISTKKSLIKTSLKSCRKPFAINPIQPKNTNYLKKESSTLFDTTDFVLLNMPAFKITFTKTQKMNLGGHNMITNKGKFAINYTAKDLAIIHFHHKKFKDQVKTSKQICISHEWINKEDDNKTIVEKLRKIKKPDSKHKRERLIESITNSKAEETYYKNCKESFHVLKYTVINSFKFKNFKKLFII